MSKLFTPTIVLENTVSTVKTLDTYSNVDESYVISTLSFIETCKSEYNAANRIFYKSILESGNDLVLVHESFSGFFDAIKKIVDQVIAYLNKMVKKFVTKFNAMLNKESYLKKNKAVFDKFTDELKFEVKGYNFNICPETPAVNVIQNFAKTMEDLDLGSYKTGDKEATTDEIVNQLQIKYNKMPTSSEYNFYDKIRGAILHRKDGIAKGKYKDELFEFFRSGSKSQDNLDITAAKVKEIYAEFEGNSDDVKKVTELRNKIEKQYKVIKANVAKASKTSADGSKVTISDFTDHDATPDMISLLDMIIKAKTAQIQEISSLHLLAFSAKLDAMKDRFKQDKTILYQALSKIEGIKESFYIAGCDVIEEDYYTFDFEKKKTGNDKVDKMINDFRNDTNITSTDAKSFFTRISALDSREIIENSASLFHVFVWILTLGIPVTLVMWALRSITQSPAIGGSEELYSGYIKSYKTHLKEVQNKIKSTKDPKDKKDFVEYATVVEQEIKKLEAFYKKNYSESYTESEDQKNTKDKKNQEGLTDFGDPDVMNYKDPDDDDDLDLSIALGETVIKFEY